jgi:hypothetical protein
MENKKKEIVPHMSDEEIVFLESILSDTKEYFEFGVGGSTFLAHQSQSIKIKGFVGEEQKLYQELTVLQLS